MSRNNNPIFVEYYSHEKCDCYKILNPWTKYRSETLVLCRVDEGYELAKSRAKENMAKWLEESLNQLVATKE